MKSSGCLEDKIMTFTFQWKISYFLIQRELTLDEMNSQCNVKSVLSLCLDHCSFLHISTSQGHSCGEINNNNYLKNLKGPFLRLLLGDGGDFDGNCVVPQLSLILDVAAVVLAVARKKQTSGLGRRAETPTSQHFHLKGIA